MQLSKAIGTSVAKQFKVILTLLVVTVLSTWALYRLNLESASTGVNTANTPDYFMQDFTTLAMDETGNPDYKLYGIYMAHYPDSDTTEILKPSIDFLSLDKPAMHVIADKGWLTANNEVVLLNGNVEFTQKDESGEPVMQINTDKARVLIDQNYVETDQFTKIVTRRTSITGTGMLADLKTGKLSVLNDVHTIIMPE